MRKSVVVGLLWGVFCGLVNGLPVASTLAQMAVPWIWIAALSGYRWANSGNGGSVLGASTLLAANVAYFAVSSISRTLAGLPPLSGSRFFILWTLVGLLVGPVAGVLGWWLKDRRNTLLAVVGLATVSIAEPLALWAHIDHLDAHVVYVAVTLAGVVFPLAYFRSDRRMALNAFALIVFVVYPAAVLIEWTLIALNQVSPPMRLI